ncbi:hypothetical protein Tco_0620916 [Tanacetum coccineum]
MMSFILVRPFCKCPFIRLMASKRKITLDVLHLLAQYLFRHAKGRKSGARLSGGHFIGRLAMHFRLVSDEGLRGLHVVAQRLERQQAAATGAHEADEAGQLMDASGQTYQPFDSTLVGSLRLSFQRSVKSRIGDASTSAAPHTDAQPDP